MKGFAFKRRHAIGLAAATLAVAAPGAFTSLTSQALASGATLNGAGSTLVQPLADEWAQHYGGQTGNTVNYQGVGSGTGIADISARTVDFGASDAPLTPAQASSCNGCVQIPWALSATGVGYHVSGIGNKLKLTGSVIAGIYLGQITSWNAPQIKKLNPGLKLPNLKITPVFRTDGSGDTYAFTNYLYDVSPAWKSAKGIYATSVNFTVGVGAKGNAGVVTQLQTTNGSIGYAAVSYLIGKSLGVAQVQNAAGNYEFPNLANISNAANSVKKVPASNELHIVDPPKSAKIAYPISTFTYAIVPKSANKQAGLLKGFINYALTTGQKFGPALDFAPLPKNVLAADKKTASSLS